MVSALSSINFWDIAFKEGGTAEVIGAKRVCKGEGMGNGDVSTQQY